jgi:hypothetical protein
MSRRRPPAGDRDRPRQSVPRCKTDSSQWQFPPAPPYPPELTVTPSHVVWSTLNVVPTGGSGSTTITPVLYSRHPAGRLSGPPRRRRPGPGPPRAAGLAGAAARGRRIDTTSLRIGESLSCYSAATRLAATTHWVLGPPTGTPLLNSPGALTPWLLRRRRSNSGCATLAAGSAVEDALSSSDASLV